MGSSRKGWKKVLKKCLGDPPSPGMILQVSPDLSKASKYLAELS